MQNSIKNYFRVGAEDFKKIPGSPIAYWASNAVRHSFESDDTLESIVDTAQGMKTLDNERFIRYWTEISFSNMNTPHKWIPINHGGDYRKWFGNNSFVVNWANDGYELKKLAREKYNSVTRTITGIEHYLHFGLTWTAISSSNFGVRFFPDGFLFSNAGMCAFGDRDNIIFSLGLLNSVVSNFILKILSPTINYGPNQIKKIPLPNSVKAKNVNSAIQLAIHIAKADWDSYETSWDFQSNPLLVVSRPWAVDSGQKINADSHNGVGATDKTLSRKITSLAEAYITLRNQWAKQTRETRELEIENNRIFIEAYGLQDELSQRVSWNEITLTCNPWYRYGKSPDDFDRVENSFYVRADGTAGTTSTTEDGQCPKNSFPFTEDLEQRLLEDTIKEFISYAVGCMMGRYSPEKPGLILANQGDGTDDYFRIMGDRDAHIAAGERFAETTSCLVDEPYSQMKCCGTTYHHVMDSDGVIPILDDEWFMDDIVAQFKAFLTLTFGEENFTRNLQFIEGALGKDLRKYFIKDFYKEHVQRYKKRPIYWLFSSPNGSFNALIYMHRYRPDTVSIVLNDYLREYMTKLGARREHLIAENNRADLSSAARTRNLKLIDKYASMLAELVAYERDILFPLAQKKIAIDLDDGVKVNYCKFGDALKKIPGLAAKEE